MKRLVAIYIYIALCIKESFSMKCVNKKCDNKKKNLAESKDAAI